MTSGNAIDGPDTPSADIPEDDMLSGDNDPTTWVSHPIDIRVSLPFLHRRYYFTIVAGQERRRKARRQEDRDTYPLVTAGNVMFTLGIATLFTVVALSLLIAQSAIIE